MLAGIGPFIQDDLVQQPFTAEAVTFDGTNDYLQKGTTPSNITDGKEGTYSFWFYLSTTATVFGISSNNGNNYYAQYQAGDMSFWYFDGAVQMELRTLTAPTASQWYHVMVSHKNDTSTAHLYLNDVDDLDYVTLNNVTFNIANGDWFIGSLDGAQYYDGDLADFVYYNKYIDLSVENNRRNFITSDGKPVDPTIRESNLGIAPIDFRGDASVWNAGTNSGSGGDFTMNGSVTDSTNEPVET